MTMEHQVSACRKLRSAIRRIKIDRDCIPVPLFLMTDPRYMPVIADTIANMPAGCGVIYRHFGCANRFDTGHELAHLCARKRLIFLISADPDLARTVRADGVHWPQARLQEARRYRRAPFVLQTASAHSRKAIWRAAQMGMDAALVSPVFVKKSVQTRQPTGPIRFRKLAQDSQLPLYALGGVDVMNCQFITDFGGLASIGAVMQAFGSQPTSTMADLR